MVKVASGSSNRWTIDNNELATEVSRKVSNETTENKTSDPDRLNRVKNVIVFRIKKSAKVEYFEKSDISLVDKTLSSCKRSE